MKDKNLAAVLAFFGGSFGLHRFYTGQIALALIYFIPIIGGLLGVIDAIAFLSMSQEDFDRRYNLEQYRTVTNRDYQDRAPRSDRERRYQERQRERAERERARQQSRAARQRAQQNPPRSSSYQPPREPAPRPQRAPRRGRRA